jgi:diguanylate cyclase (GGDEF)-like protein
LYSKIFNSLRGRYIVVAGLVTSVVLASAFLGYTQLEKARQITDNNIAARNQLLERSRLVRQAVWTMRESLAAFMLNPDIVEQRNAILRALTDARQQTDTLLEHQWIKQQHHQDNIRLLKKSLAELETAVTELIETRVDITLQYPAIALARAEMLPNHSIFYTAADLAIREILEEPVTFRNQQAYHLFVDARHIWTQMISNFRMYLANRLGSFDESVLPVQEKDVKTQFQGLQRILNQLQTLDAQEQLDFQGSVSLADLNSAANKWFSTFQEIKRIHNSDEWRADAKLIRTNIKPHMESIWSTLINLDKSIENSANNDVSILTRVAESQTQTLWILTALSLCLIAAGFYALERMIIRPVSSIATALKTESQNLEGGILQNYDTHETKNLVDAFINMRKQVQARQVALEYHALHDSLTNLGNRNRLTDNLNLAIKIAARENSSLALLMLDLDHFKEVNDALGHPAGDQLLINVGQRLAKLLRNGDTIARLGGDEFAILLPTANENNAIKIAEKIATALSHPFDMEKRQLYTSASIGITIYPEHGANARTLIQHADIAMYQAKNSKSRLAVYDPEQDNHSLQRLGLMADLRKALTHDALDVYYQAQTNLTDNSVIGMEALLRWQHPQYGFIAPEEIIRLAEQTGLIHDVAIWVLNRAISETKRWLNAGVDLTVAVNLSAHNLENDKLIHQVKSLLQRTHFPAERLTLEITENAMMARPEQAVDILTQLDEMGVQLSVDDFGTGFSSLGYLKRLPVNELKIDKSFVTDMVNNENDAVIVRSTIDLAHNLGLKVVAEGVEDQETWDLLQILRCDLVQGYFISKPIPANEFWNWLQARHPHLESVQPFTGQSAG